MIHTLECMHNMFVFIKKNINIFRGASVSHCGEYLIITPLKGCKNNLLYFTKFEKNTEITGKLDLTAVVEEFDADYEVIILKYMVLNYMVS